MQIDLHLKEKNTRLYGKAPFLTSGSDCPLSLLCPFVYEQPPHALRGPHLHIILVIFVHYLPTCLMWWLAPSWLLLLCPLLNSLPLETLKKKVIFSPVSKFVALLNLWIKSKHPSLLLKTSVNFAWLMQCVWSPRSDISLLPWSGVSWELPGGPVVRTPHFLCLGRSFDPWLENHSSNHDRITYAFRLSARSPHTFPLRSLQVRSCFLSLPRKPRSTLNSRISSSFLKKSVSPSQTEDSVDQPRPLQGSSVLNSLRNPGL